MKPHLLYIAFWYPPSRASGVYRAIATTKEFLDSGWDVTVITTTTEFLQDEIGSIDESLIAHIPESAQVVRVPFTFETAALLDIRALGRFGANFPSFRDALERNWAGLRRGWPFLRVADHIAENYVSWIPPVVHAGDRLDERRTIDHILATGNPYSSFEAARRLGSRLGTSFSVDYRDPWTIDVFTGRSNIADAATTEAERRIVSEASWCFHVNEAIADAYMEKYPESAVKHRVVYNGYDEDSIPGPSAPATEPYRLGILGTLNDRWPVGPLFAAWASARNQFPLGSELVLGGHLGYFARSQEVLEGLLPDESDGFRYVGPIPKSEVADFYASLDVLIVPVPGGPMVTSGKIFEALAVGKPFVCIQADGGGARKLADESPLGIGVEPNKSSIGEGLHRALEMARRLDPQDSLRARAQAAKFERHKALAPLVDSISGRPHVGTTT